MRFCNSHIISAPEAEADILWHDTADENKNIHRCINCGFDLGDHRDKVCPSRVKITSDVHIITPQIFAFAFFRGLQGDMIRAWEIFNDVL